MSNKIIMLTTNEAHEITGKSKRWLQRFCRDHASDFFPQNVYKDAYGQWHISLHYLFRKMILERFDKDLQHLMRICISDTTIVRCSDFYERWENRAKMFGIHEDSHLK